MFSYNRVELIGRVGNPVASQHTPTGQLVAKFNLATDRLTKPGEPPIVDWHAVVCWAKLAEFAAQHLDKGRLVFVTGRLTYRTWEGTDGRKRHVTEIVASELIPLDRPSKPEAETSATTEHGAQ